MGDLTTEYNTDLNRIAEIRSKGEALEHIDEQRLRDHQLRRLRRLWLKDQCLTAREPLLPPKKLNWYTRFRANEETFWSKHLKFRKLPDYLYHGKDYNQVPLLWVYQFQRAVRRALTFVVLPVLPIFYFLKYGGLDTPGSTVEWNPTVLPGDKYISARKGDMKFDRRTSTYIPVENPDDWQNVLK